MLTTIKVKDILPNPFRRLEEYPLHREKIDSLKDSIEATDFWPTVVVRQVGNKYELAFGHHRWKALQELGIKEIRVNVEKLDNNMMYQMMCRENLEEYKTDAWVELENVRAGIMGIASGDLTPEKVPGMPPIPAKTSKSNLRYAPSVLLDVSPTGDSHPYTAVQVAVLSGMVKKQRDGVRPNFACETAFQALELIERGLLKESIVKGMSRSQLCDTVRNQKAILESHRRAAAVKKADAEAERKRAEQAETEAERRLAQKRAAAFQREAEQAERDAEVKTKTFAKEAAKAFESGQKGKGIKPMREVAESYKAPASKQQRQTVTDLHGLAEKISKVAHQIANDDHISAWVPVFIKNIDDAEGSDIKTVKDALISAEKRLMALRTKLQRKVRA